MCSSLYPHVVRSNQPSFPPNDTCLGFICLEYSFCVRVSLILPFPHIKQLPQRVFHFDPRQLPPLQPCCLSKQGDICTGSGCPLQCVLQCSQSNPRANMEGLQTRGGRKHRYQGLPASELQGQEQEPATQPNARGCRATSSTGGMLHLKMRSTHCCWRHSRFTWCQGQELAVVLLTFRDPYSAWILSLILRPLWAGLNTWLPNDRELTRFTIKYMLLCSDPGGIHPNRNNSLPYSHQRKCSVC